MTKTQQRLAVVLDRIKAMSATSEDDAEMFSGCLNEMLDDLQDADAFGTEGQYDPRGDQRDGWWSMHRVEGVDE